MSSYDRDEDLRSYRGGRLENRADRGDRGDRSYRGDRGDRSYRGDSRRDSSQRSSSRYPSQSSSSRYTSQSSSSSRYDSSQSSSSRYDAKRRREDDSAPRRGKFQRGGGRGRGRGRGGRGGGRGGARKCIEEFKDSPVTRPHDMNVKTAFNNELTKADEKLRLCANYFRVGTSKTISMQMYRIDFNPDVTNRNLKKALISQHRAVLGAYVFDEGNSIYLMNSLPDDKFELTSETNDGRRHTIRFRKSRTIQFTDAMFFTILNLIIRNAMSSLQLQLVGRNYYDARASIDIPELRLQLWPGYITSIRQHEQNLLLCCDLSHKVMRQDNVYGIIRECQKNDPVNYKVVVAKRLLGTTVLTDFNNKTYKIDDIDWGQNPESKFSMQNGEKSYISYYKEKYQIDIRDRRQPMLISKAKARDIRGGKSELICLIPELCRATGLTDQMRNDFRQMKELAERTRMTPSDRFERLTNFNRRLNENEKSVQSFRENCLTLDKKLVEFDARRMKQEIIYFGGDSQVDIQSSGKMREVVDWTKCLQDYKMYTTEVLNRWIIMFPGKFNNEKNIFMTAFYDVAETLGMEISRKVKEVELPDELTTTYTNALEDCIGQLPKFIIIIVGNNKADRYNAIKKVCLCNEKFDPQPNQVIVLKTLHKKELRSVITKVVIQVNCKLGGIPWMVKIPLQGTMIIGFDASHDANDKRKSYGAMVASLNPNLNSKGGKFFSCVNSHQNGEDISCSFGNNVIAAAHEYRRENGTYPCRVLIYRDGVGDGQIEYVYNQEVKDVILKLNELYKDFPMCENEKGEVAHEHPKVGFIVINKRINTRIFRRDHHDRFENPLPGTVVDDVITLPERYDFYLISQNVNQGTVAPTSYNIIYDNFGIPPAHLQQLTYKMCHLYYNWSGTTRVPSVVQYAKKLAFLVSQNLHQEPNSNRLASYQQLYFL